MIKYLLGLSFVLMVGAGAYKEFFLGENPMLPGQSLKKGMFLEYEASDGTFPKYEVLDVEHGVTVSEADSCTEISMSYDGSPKATRTECIVGDYLHQVDTKGVLSRVRPLGESMTFEKRDAEGVLKSRYSTTTFETVKVEGEEIETINTEVHYFNKEGRVTSRLIEKYAPLYSTATSGSFQGKDEAHPNGWKANLDFKMKKITF